MSDKIPNGTGWRVARYEQVLVICPACNAMHAHVYHDDEYERLVCDHCFYEEWNQPQGTYPVLTTGGTAASERVL